MCIQETYKIIEKHLESYKNNEKNITELLISYIQEKCIKCKEKIIEYNECDFCIEEEEEDFDNIYCKKCVSIYKGINKEKKSCVSCFIDNGGFRCMKCKEINVMGIFGDKSCGSRCYYCFEKLKNCKNCGYVDNIGWVNVKEKNKEEISICFYCVENEL